MLGTVGFFITAGSARAFGPTPDPYADRVISYTAGAGVSASYQNASVTLRSPERITGEFFAFPTVVTPFNPPFAPDEIAGIGAGGSLVVAFDEPVMDDPANPFGLDLLVFGNAFYNDRAYPNGRASGVISASSSGTLEVSQDGIAWFTIPNAYPDNLFPTLAYSDLTESQTDVPGNVPSDFTKPVDPSFNAIGTSYLQLLAAYNGSGGGTGVDISSSGLAFISFVRVSNSLGQLEIDGFSDVSPVPGPTAFCLIFPAAALFSRRRR